MTEYDTEITVEQAREKFPEANPKTITYNSPQYSAKEFEQYLNEAGYGYDKSRFIGETIYGFF